MTTIAYHRGPRPAPPEVPRDPVVVRTPAPLEDSGRLLRILQVVAPLAAAGTGLVFILAYRQQGSLLLIAMGAAIGVGVLVGVLTAVVQSRVSARRRRRAKQRYFGYLDSVRQHLDALLELQLRHEADVVPEHRELVSRAREHRRLFERRPVDVDFLVVRAGTGALPSPAPVELQAVDPLGPELDPELLRAAEDLVAQYATRASGPRSLALRDGGTLVMRGEAEGVRALARSIVLQAAVLHSPDELRIAVIGDEQAVDADWDWIKWLPHARRDEQTFGVFCATDAAAAAAMLGDLRARSATGSAPPHVLLVIDRWSPGSEVARIAELTALMSAASPSPASVLCLVEREGDEPAEMGRRLVILDAAARIEDAGARAVGAAFQPDTLSAADAAAAARMLAPLSSGGEAHQDASATTPTLANAMGLRTFEDLDAATTWTAAPASLLEAPMGTTPDGRTLVLDLKEFAQGGMGPHGMLVGAPGAGKSELLRTLVAALAATHPPDLLAFVLVDFKGGAAFQPLARLPHVAGIVTNLEDDRSMVERFRLAIEGEVTRRQAVFRAAGNVPDIRTYQWRQASDPSLESLPYLWLVVDEFAELLANFPDFDTFFEGVARLGRGLGIHLLLATQGVSSGLSRLDRYLSYRVALRTNSVADSMAVLGSNAAARLPLVPGLGYLKVGQTEAEPFTAYHVSEPVADGTGGPDHHPKVRVFKAIAPDGIGAARGTGVDPPLTPPRTHLDVIVERVLAAGAARAHPVWVTPLPHALPLDSVLSDEERPLVVPLGLADLPMEQRQFRWGIDFAGQDGHVAVVGAPRTGRSTALRTIVSSFLLSHDPEDAQFYIIDMGGALQPLACAPHVGAVAGKNEPELARRMLRFLARAVDERDARLRRLGIGSIAELRSQRRNGDKDDGLGDLFLVIDNWAAATKAFDWIDEEVTALAGVGLSYGVHVVLSADRWGDIRPSLRDRIPGRIQLRPIEAGDSIVDARTTRALTNTPGRALVPAGFQVQLALPRVDGVADIADADSSFRELVGRSARSGRAAPRMKLLPDVVPVEGFDWARWRGSGTVPIGIDDSDVQPVTLDLFSPEVQHLLVAGDSRCGKSSFLRAYLDAVTRVSTPEQVQFHIVDIRRGLLDAVPERYIAAHAMSAADVESLVAALQETLRTRVAPAGASRRALAERAHVAGPELVLVIDDDDLVDSYVLRPLVASVAVAWDMKFHVVLARRPANAAFDGIASALVSAGAVCLEMDEASRSLVRSRPVSLPPGRAHLLGRGEQPLLVQLIHPAADDDRSAETWETAFEHAG